MSIATSWDCSYFLFYVGHVCVVAPTLSFYRTIGEPCMDVVALFIKRGKSLF
jgi:hypothetical protein